MKAIKNYKSGGALDLTPSGKTKRRLNQATRKALRDKKKAARNSNVRDIVSAGVPSNPRFMTGQVTRKNGVAPAKPDPPKKKKRKILNSVGSRPARAKRQPRVRIPESCKKSYCP